MPVCDLPYAICELALRRYPFAKPVLRLSPRPFRKHATGEINAPARLHEYVRYHVHTNSESV
jgi:hypothetical protein